jgi:hypothetical protein
MVFVLLLLDEDEESLVSVAEGETALVTLDDCP